MKHFNGFVEESSGQNSYNAAKNCLSLEEKRALSNQKRLESVKLQKSAFEAQKRAIASSLSAVTGESNVSGAALPNKKIKFSDSSDDSDSERKSAVISKEKSKRKLFDEDSDNSDGPEPDFKVKKHFQGESGSKLARLESRFGGDSRFRMSEKFLDDENNTELPTNSISDGKEEQKNQLAILEKVLGHSVSSKLRENDSKWDRQPKPGMVRFDPSNPDHKKYQLATDLASNDKINLSKPNPKPSSTIVQSDSSVSDSEDGEESDSSSADESNKPQKSEGASFHLDPSFAQAIKRKLQGKLDEGEDKPFSLLASLGLSTEILEKTTKTVDKAEEIVPTSYKSWQKEILASNSTRRTFDDADSSETDSEAEAEKTLKISSEHIETDKSVVKKPSFFLTKTHPSVQKALAKFKRNEPLDEIKKKWNQFRPSLIKLYKRQRKEALQRKKDRLARIQRHRSKNTFETSKKNREKIEWLAL